MRNALLSSATCLLLISMSARAQDFEKVDYGAALELADLLSQIQGVKADIDKVKDLFKKDLAEVNTIIQSDAAIRASLKVYVEKYALVLIEKGKKNESIRSFVAISDQLIIIEKSLNTIKQRIDSAVAIEQKEYDDAKALIKQLVIIRDAKGKALIFVKDKLSNALKDPYEIPVGGKNLTIRVVSGTDKLFSDSSELAIKVEYPGGLSATITGLRVTDTGELILLNSAKIQPDTDTLRAAALQAAGEALKSVNLPLPVKLEGLTGELVSGLPILNISASISIPGLESVQSLLSSAKNGGKLLATFEVDPVSKTIKLKKVDKLIFAPPFSIPLGTSGVQLSVNGFGIDIGASIKYIDILGSIEPVGPPGGTGEGVSLAIITHIPVSGSGAVNLTGTVLLAKQAVGDFELSISDKEVKGSLTFPAKGPTASITGAMYRGNFSFKLDKSALTAEGIAEVFTVIKANFELYFSLMGKESTFKSTSKLSLDGITGEASVFAKLSEKYKSFSASATVWVGVDLGVYKPTARVEIAIPEKEIININPAIPGFGLQYQIEASALGIKVSWSVPSLDLLTIKDVEKRLLEQIDNMFNRISSAAAEWEKDKRELLARWESHWAETLSSEAKKYGVDKISTGIKPVDDALGSLSNAGKGAGDFLVQGGRGIGRQWNGAREATGGVVNEVKKIIPGLSSNIKNNFEPLNINKAFFVNTNNRHNSEIAALWNNSEELVVLEDPPLPQYAKIFTLLYLQSKNGKLKELKEIADFIKVEVPDKDVRSNLAEALKKGLIKDGYGQRLKKAITEQDYSPPSDEEIAAVKPIIAELPLWVNGLVKYGDASKDFASLADAVNSYAVIKENTDSMGTLKQLQIGFGDSVVHIDDKQIVTIAFIARISVFVRTLDGKRQSATNIVPITLTFKPVKTYGFAYTLDLGVPDVLSVNQKQLDWMKKTDPAYGFRQVDGAYVDFDQTQLDTPDKAKSYLQMLFGLNGSSSNPLDVQRIVRHSIETLTDSSGISFSYNGIHSFHEKKIAFHNTTDQEVILRIKVKQRRIENGSFQWTWYPTVLDDSKYYEYRLPPFATKSLSLKLDNGKSADDFGSSAPPIVASRFRAIITSQSGEIWSYLDQDIFTVQSDDKLGGDRTYDAVDYDTFLFTVQSKRAPNISAITIYRNNDSIVEHQGSAISQFDLPINSVDISSLLESLSVERVIRSGSDPKNIKTIETSWEATIPSELLNSKFEHTSSTRDAREKAIRINLTPGSSNSTPPGMLIPTEEIQIRYKQQSKGWNPGYRLNINKSINFPGTLTGWNLFENGTGMDWNGVEVRLKNDKVLINGAQQSDSSILPNVSLPKQNARLSLQSPVPLNVKVEPQLVYDASIHKLYPIARTRISLNDNATSPLFSGPLVIIDNNEYKAKLVLPNLSKGDFSILNYPEIHDDRVCITYKNASDLKYEGTCLRSGCFEYVPYQRTLHFQANYSEKYSSSITKLTIISQNEKGWKSSAEDVEIGGQLPLQFLETVQYRDSGWLPRSLDLRSCSIIELKSIILKQNDLYAELISNAIKCKEENRWSNLSVLLAKPDLIIESVQAGACPPHVGKKFSITITLKNNGGCPAIFKTGQRLLIGKGFNDFTASTGEICINPCCRYVVTLQYDNVLPPGDLNLEFTVDPDDVISEWHEANNTFKSTLRIKP